MKKLFLMAAIAIFSPSGLLAQKIEFYTPCIVRVTRDNGMDATKKVSLVVTAEPQNVAVSKKTENGKTAYSTDQLNVTVENGKVSFYDTNGNVLMTEGEYAFTPRHTGPDCMSYKVRQNFSVEPDEAIYGIGMLQNGKMNRSVAWSRRIQRITLISTKALKVMECIGTTTRRLSSPFLKRAMPANLSSNRKSAI